MKTSRVRRRLTAWYALSTLGVLLVALLLMRSYARQALLKQHERGVTRSAELVRSFFRAEFEEYRRVPFTVQHVAGELVFAGLTIEFLTPEHDVVATVRRPVASIMLQPVGERTVALEPAMAPGWGMRLRYSLADLVDARDHLDRLTLLAAAIAVALSALVAWFMTGRALEPAGDMARAAAGLGTRPSQRLPVANADDEFGRLGSAFNGLLERLEGVLLQQQRFLADAAHELRTPVARMLGDSEARLAEPPSADDRESLTRLHDELARTSHLVDQLLHMAQSDAGALPIVRVPLFLDDAVVDAVAPWEREAEQHGLTLDFANLEEARVEGDRVLLQRLVGALMENAVRYTPDGGRIAVSVRATDTGAMLTVEDSGIGVPEAERASIFERFGRGVEARQRVPGGSGLGLAIAMRIARQHGATMTVDDSPLGGARFVVAFPRSAA